MTALAVGLFVARLVCQTFSLSSHSVLGMTCGSVRAGERSDTSASAAAVSGLGVVASQPMIPVLCFTMIHSSVKEEPSIMALHARTGERHPKVCHWFRVLRCVIGLLSVLVSPTVSPIVSRQRDRWAGASGLLFFLDLVVPLLVALPVSRRIHCLVSGSVFF